MRVLFATDGSVHSEAAGRELLALGLPRDAEVVILHVKEPPFYITTPLVPPSYGMEWRRVQQEMEAEVEQTTARAIGQGERIFAAANVGVRVSTTEGHPADEIVRTAGEIEADLVVVGSKGLTGGELFLLGSVSQKVTRYAPCSVLLVRPPRSPEAIKISKIILATDGSENAMEAARFLSSFEVHDDAEIVLLHVVQQPHGLTLSASAEQALESVRQSRLAHARDLLRDTQSHLKTRARVTTEIREGHPAEQILQASTEMAADLIVVGSKGLSAVKRFLLGSVSQSVYRYSDRSVLLVRTGQRPVPQAEG